MVDEFTPLGIKRLSDKWIAQLELQGAGWELKTDEPKIKIWVNYKGIPTAPDWPIVQAESYFPDIDDPRILLAAILWFREEFDSEDKTVCEVLPQFSNDNTMVRRFVSKASMMASARESVEKFCYFKTSRALDGLPEAIAIEELSTGALEDIYILNSAVPLQTSPVQDKNHVRIDRMFGFATIGWRENLPMNRRGKRPKGLYLHDLFATDVKIGGSWVLKMALPIMQNSMKAWTDNFRNYVKKNLSKLEAFVEQNAEEKFS